ncbi:MAG: NAD-dependent epimerase/dehydratase family protein, partial [Elusimicrobia bacterium]|nr:NAD-dependent epimerase/dehydratase family protein [Elusimicrobiota bacterium]
MKVAVTGAGGFLGSAVARLLLRRGHQVRAFCRGPRPDLEAEGMAVVLGDLAEPAALGRACRGAEGVVHCAAKVGLWGPYEEFHRTNVLGTAAVIAACRELSIPRLVFTSSPSAACGPGDVEGADESIPCPARFDSPYARSKAAAEAMVLRAATGTLATAALRPHLVWGPGEDKLVRRLIEKARAGELRRIGSADKLVDATYIDDAAEA